MLGESRIISEVDYIQTDFPGKNAKKLIGLDMKRKFICLDQLWTVSDIYIRSIIRTYMAIHVVHEKLAAYKSTSNWAPILSRFQSAKVLGL